MFTAFCYERDSTNLAMVCKLEAFVKNIELGGTSSKVRLNMH